MRIIGVLAFCLFQSAAFSQTSIINQSLTDSSLNILYIGVDNLIKINPGKTIGPYTMTIAGADGMIAKLETNLYAVRVTRDGVCELTGIRGGKKLFTKTFTAMISPPLAISLNGYRATVLSKGKIL